MATLTNTKIKDTYPALLKASDNGVIGATEKVITDGLGNDSVLKLGTTSASFTSDIEVNSLTIGRGSGDLGSNVVLGFNALDSNTTGSSNTAIGSTSLNANTTGSQNTALGNSALYSNQTGGNNTALGYFGLRNNTTGSFNVAVGSSSLEDNIDGADNVAVGYSSLSSNTSGSQNIAVGRQALLSNTTGGNNTAVGHSSLVGNITGINNTAVGRSSLFANTGSNNTAVGAYALLDNTTGTSNAALGYTALTNNTTGSNNTSLGADSMNANTTGSRNTAVGFNALDSNTEGSDNTAIGHNALDGNTTGVKNTAVGRDALLQVSTGFQNTALGFEAANDVTTGSNNVHIGYQATASSATVSNEIVIGSGATGNGSNTATYGNSNITDHYFDGNITLTDATNPVLTVQDTAGGSSFLRLLAGDTGTSNIYLGDATDDNAGAIVYDHSDNSMSFRTNGFLEKMHIDSSGRVGIGTDLPTEDLQIESIGSSFIYMSSGTASPATLGMRMGQSISSGAADAEVSFDVQDSLFQIKTGTAAGTRRLTIQKNSGKVDITNDFAVDTNTLYVDAANNAVGVGTTSVTGTYGKLSIAGGMRILDDSNAKLEIGRYSAAASNSYIKMGANSNSLRFTDHNDQFDLVTIQNDGNVGIGTSSLNTISGSNPTLTLAGTGITGGLILQNSGTDTARIYETGNLLIHQGMSGIGHSFYVNAVSEAMRIDSSGNVGIGTSSPIAITNGLGLTIGNSSTQHQPYLSLSRNRLGGYFAGVQILNEGSVSSYMQEDGDGNLRFGTANTERMRILSTGGITFNGDTAAANALDDYEEGTWTMGIAFGGASTGVTYSANLGTYTKVGRQVTVNGYIQLSSKGSSTGSATITGLPFGIPNVLRNYSAPSLFLDKVTFANQYAGVGAINTTTIGLQECTIVGGVSSLNEGDFANNSEIILSFTYFV